MIGTGFPPGAKPFLRVTVDIPHWTSLDADWRIPLSY